MAESTHGSTAKLLAEISNVLEDGLPRSVDEIVLNPPVIAAMRDLTEALMKSSNKFQLEGNGLFKLAPVAQKSTQVGFGSSSDTASTAEKPLEALPVCVYGSNCFRKNPTHLEQYYHPPAMPEIVKEDALKVLDSLIALPCAAPFRQPVDFVSLGLVDYPAIIKKPMDLSTVRHKLESGQYMKYSELVNDIRLILNNCMVYNLPDSEIVKIADKFANLSLSVFNMMGSGVSMEPHRLHGLHIARHKTDALLTKLPFVRPIYLETSTTKSPTPYFYNGSYYLEFNPFASRLAAAILGGITGIYVTDVVSRILYVGGDDESAFVTLLHLANMAANSKVYTIRRPSWSALIQQAEGYGYENIVFLAEDYQLESLSEQFNVLIVDDFQSTAPLAAYAAKALHAVGPQGGVMLLMNASVISPERKPEEVFAGVVREMRELKPQLRPKEQLTLEPFERNCAWLSAERRTQ